MRLEFIWPELIVFLIIFARTGALFMLLPVFSHVAIPARIRLVLALSISLILLPTIRHLFVLPDVASSFWSILITETLIGLMLGLLVRLSFSVLDIAGTIIAYQSGMALAIIVDTNNNGQQSSIFTGFLTMLAILLIITLNLHHLMLIGIKSSYELHSPAANLPIAQLSAYAVSLAADCFVIAMQVSAPFIFFSLIFNIGLALMSRLMPQLQVFFVAMPLNIIISFLMLMILLGTIMENYLEYFTDNLTTLLQGKL